MIVDGTFTFKYCDSKIAEDMAKLIHIDNTIAPKTLKIITFNDENNVVTTITSKKTSTFFSTVDDLFFSEKLISNTMEI